MVSRRSGFTVLESIVVLGIVAIILGMSVPQFSKFIRQSKINSAANQITGVMRTARSYAISKSDNFSVNFNNTISPNAIWITDSLSNLIDKRYELPENVTIARSDGSDPITFTDDMVTFKPTGGSIYSGSVYLLSTGGDEKRISVINTTGRVKIY